MEMGDVKDVRVEEVELEGSVPWGFGIAITPMIGRRRYFKCMIAFRRWEGGYGWAFRLIARTDTETCATENMMSPIRLNKQYE
jgi:hypothetical protein